MFREMRRKDRQITDREWIDGVLREAEVLELGIIGTDGWPYVVPLNFGYDGKCIYFHGAPAGLKFELLERSNKVCFQTYVRASLTRDELPTKYSYQFSSVTGFGRVIVIEDLEEKIAALNVLMGHVDGPMVDRVRDEEALKHVRCARIDIEHISGKLHL